MHQNIKKNLVVCKSKTIGPLRIRINWALAGRRWLTWLSAAYREYNNNKKHGRYDIFSHHLFCTNDNPPHDYCLSTTTFANMADMQLSDNDKPFVKSDYICCKCCAQVLPTTEFSTRQLKNFHRDDIGIAKCRSCMSALEIEKEKIVVALKASV